MNQNHRIDTSVSFLRRGGVSQRATMNLLSNLLLTTLIAFCHTQDDSPHCEGQDEIDYSSIYCSYIKDISTMTDVLSSVTHKIEGLRISDSPDLHLHWEALNIPALQDIKDVRLENNNLSEFHSENFHPQNLERVSLSSNSLVSINATTFQGLAAAKKLLLFRNEISSIHNSAFKHLIHLEVLDLSYNKLTAIDAVLFEGLPLEALHLGNNLLNSIEERSFHGLDKLVRLFLSHNEIKTIDSRAFQTLRNLEVVELGNNELQGLDSRLFENLNLLGLDVSTNDLVNISKFQFNSTTIRALGLANCNIHEIPDNYFENIPNLLMLILAQNNISFINDNVLTPMVELRVVNLSLNNLTSLSVTTFQQFYKILQQSTITLDTAKVSVPIEQNVTLHSNPWDCGSEDMTNLRAWTVEHDVEFDDIFKKCKV